MAIGVVDGLEAIEVDQQDSASADPNWARSARLWSSVRSKAAAIGQQRVRPDRASALNPPFAQLDLFGGSTQPLHDEDEDAREQQGHQDQGPEEAMMAHLRRAGRRPG